MSRVATKPAVAWLTSVIAWFDNAAAWNDVSDRERNTIDWLRAIPFFLLHIACLAVIWVGWSPVAVAIAVMLYLLRMFAVTAFYHRYFAHRAFRTSRPLQFLFAILGASAVQRGPLWWASHHRHHHAYSDHERDEHSPVLRSFLWSHTGWFLCRRNFAIRERLVRDFIKFPELRFLDRFDVIVPTLLAAALYFLGEYLAIHMPALETSGLQLLVWGFVISTVALYHATFMINSLAHCFGSRRFNTRDNSRNNPLLALMTLGEGWHNNHHYYPGSARQGFYWWEIDITFYVLKVMNRLGLIWDLRPVPERVMAAGTKS
jgi:stearoyl-CoA desaturase (delta-9 desaturase)